MIVPLCESRMVPLTAEDIRIQLRQPASVDWMRKHDRIDADYMRHLAFITLDERECVKE